MYPQWGRNSSSAAPKRALDDSNATSLIALPKSKNRRPLTESKKAAIRASISHTQTSSLTDSAKEEDDSTKAAINASSHYVDVDSKEIADSSAVQISPSTSIDSKEPALESSVVSLDFSVPQPSMDKAFTAPALSTTTNALRGSMKFKTHSEAHESSDVLVDIERMVERIMRANEKTRSSHLSARSFREEFQEFRREVTNNWAPDWRKVVEALINNTPRDDQWYEKQIKLVVPPKGTNRLLSDLDSSIWDIEGRYDCFIAVQGIRHDTEQDPGVFVLSGSKSAISSALADILLVAPDAQIMANDQHTTYLRLHDKSGPQTPSLALAEPQQADSDQLVATAVRVARLNTFYGKPEDVPKPSAWTKESLLDYVRNLTRSDKNKTVSYFHATVKFLTNLFRDPDADLRAAVTRTACHEALRYLVSANQIVDVRVLIVRMELFGLAFTPETFNIMLRGVAKSKDIHNFHFLLHLMIKRGLKPNGQTWIAFLRTMEDSQMKIHVAIAMKAQGLLMHKFVMKGVCEQLVKQEVELSLDANQDQETFVAHMDARYGQDWLSKNSGSRILDVLGSQGLISRCWDFLQFMDSRHIYPNQYCITTILRHCRQIHNLDGAVELMQNISPAWGFQPDQETFKFLFGLAQDTRMFNVAKVVWKYACITGLISTGMPERIQKSMRNAWNVPHTPRQRWAYYSGSVIFGTYGGLHPVRSLEQNGLERVRLSQRGLDWDFVMNDPAPLERLNGIGPFPPNPMPEYKPAFPRDPPDSALQIELREKHYPFMKAEFQFDRDLSKYTVGFFPRYSFEKMLSEAWAQDKQWREDGTYRNATLRWMIAKAIRIPMKSEADATPDLIL